MRCHMLALFLVVSADDDLLDLVELVDAVEAGGVLAIGAGLAAEAGGEGDVVSGQVGFVQNFIHVVGGEADFAGAGEEADFLGGVVDFADAVGLLAAGGEEAGAAHGGLAHQHGDAHGGETLFEDHEVLGQPQHGLVQQGAGGRSGRKTASQRVSRRGRRRKGPGALPSSMWVWAVNRTCRGWPHLRISTLSSRGLADGHIVIRGQRNGEQQFLDLEGQGP